MPSRWIAFTSTKAWAASAPGCQAFHAAFGYGMGRPLPSRTPTAGPLDPVQRGPDTNVLPPVTATPFQIIESLRAASVRCGCAETGIIPADSSPIVTIAVMPLFFIVERLPLPSIALPDGYQEALSRSAPHAVEHQWIGAGLIDMEVKYARLAATGCLLSII